MKNSIISDKNGIIFKFQDDERKNYNKERIEM
jgi:hypothetical protein